MTLESYTEPVSRLLTYGDCRKITGEWPDYVAELELSDEHIPELIKMMTDPVLANLDSDRIEVWAPVHAWRSLGQLGAEEAIEPLIQLCLQDDGDEWLHSEIPDVFGMIGPAAIQPIKTVLEQGSALHTFNDQTVAYATLIDGLKEMSLRHPEQAEECIASLVTGLEHYESNDQFVNACFIDSLIDLKVVSAAPLIEEVFGSGRVDEFMVGTWPYVQVQLGLKDISDFSEAELRSELPEEAKKLIQTLEALNLKHNKPQGFGQGGSQKSKKKKKKKK